MQMPHVSTADVLRLFWQHATKYKWSMTTLYVCIVLAEGVELLVPWYFKKFLDLLTTEPPVAASFHLVIQPVLIMMAIEIVRQALWRIYGFTIVVFQPKVMAALQETSTRVLLGQSYDFFSNSFAGALVRKVARIGRSFEDVDDEIKFRFIPVLLTLVGAAIGLGLRQPWLGIGFTVWAMAFIILNYLGARWKMGLDVEKAAADSAVTATLADILTNSTTVKLFNGSSSEQARFGQSAQAWRRLATRAWGRGEVIFTVQSVLMIICNTGLLWLGAYYWSQGKLTVGDLALIQGYLVIAFNKLWDVGRSFRKISESIADAKEMVEILQLAPSVRDRRGAKELLVRKASIQFKDVSFHYHATRPVLDHFALTVAPGEKIALVGPSGAGKSTVTKLLFRFYDIDGGTLLIDGQDISRVSQESLRAQIALVPQEPVLFHRTLMENIRYGRPDATDAEVEHAATLARCHEFIADLPDGYGTFVGERGVKLSGGERQRVAIARAILKNAPILVLDEATSSLDSESEQLIQEALKEVMRGKTTVVVAHRLSTIMQMDRIVVMEDGQVATVGTHKELLSQKGTYRTLWNIQAGGFAEA